MKTLLREPLDARFEESLQSVVQAYKVKVESIRRIEPSAAKANS